MMARKNRARLGLGAALAVAPAEATPRPYSTVALDGQLCVIEATRNVEAARADLARARLEKARAEVAAPITGTILDIQVTQGQRPTAEGMRDMGDAGLMIAEVETLRK